MPAGIVVILGRLVEAHTKVVHGADPLGGVDDAALQRGEDLAAGQQHHGAASLADDLAAQAGDAHLEALVVVDGVHVLAEPAAHLDARVALGTRDDVKRRVDLFPEFRPPPL